MSADQDLHSIWDLNAQAWTRAVRTGAIRSRVLATDAALLAAIGECAPRRLLDLGCGEGWLARALCPGGIDYLGVDVSQALIDSARDAGIGRFEQASYADLSTLEPAFHPDVVVCNFALFGQSEPQTMLHAVRRRIATNGRLIVQTLHPHSDSGVPYADGWREAGWDGLGGGFQGSNRWYFRTLESWLGAFTNSGFALAELREPMNPETGRPASVLFVLVPA